VQRQVSSDMVLTFDYFHKNIDDITTIRATNLAFEARMPNLGNEAEAAAQQENSAQVRSLGPLSDLPLVVLSHDPDKVRFPGNLTDPVNREWANMQEELAHLSSNGSHVVVKGSGHDIQIDKPEAVVDAIRKVVGQAGEWRGRRDSNSRPLP